MVGSVPWCFPNGCIFGSFENMDKFFIRRSVEFPSSSCILSGLQAMIALYCLVAVVTVALGFIKPKLQSE